MKCESQETHRKKFDEEAPFITNPTRGSSQNSPFCKTSLYIVKTFKLIMKFLILSGTLGLYSLT